MSSETQQAICKGCKSDLTKESHKEDCPVLANQKAEDLAKIAEQEKIKSDKIIADAKEKAEKDLKKIYDADVEKIKQDLIKANKSEQKILVIKNKIIDKIALYAPAEQVNRTALLTYDVTELAGIYKKVIDLVLQEKKYKFDTTCPICREFLGSTVTREEGKILSKKHRSEKHGSSVGSWIVTGVIFTMLAAGAYAGYKILKKRKKNCSDCDEEKK